MAFKYTNNSNVSLPLAVWLMEDDYDYDDRTNLISATSLLKPTRALVLKIQNIGLDKEVDITELVSARMGSALHAIAEKAWNNKDNIKKALEAMGASNVFDRFVINPTGALNIDAIPVYIEQRHETEIDGFIISGKYDLVLDGTISDYKSTSVWTYIYDSNAIKYTQQGSVYKWLAPERITGNTIDIQFIFTDWSSAQALRDSNYPQSRVLTKSYPLWSTDRTESYIKAKLADITRYTSMTQDELPKCTSEELWESATKYKYFKNPNAQRATKNFDNLEAANQRMADDGMVGTIKTVPGEAKACRYCEVVGICKQAQLLEAAGRLTL